MNPERLFQIIKKQHPDQVKKDSLEDYNRYTQSGKPLCLVSRGAGIVTGIETVQLTEDTARQVVTVSCLSCLTHGAGAEHNLEFYGDPMPEERLKDNAQMSLFYACPFREEI